MRINIGLALLDLVMFVSSTLENKPRDNNTEYTRVVRIVSNLKIIIIIIIIINITII